MRKSDLKYIVILIYLLSSPSLLMKFILMELGVNSTYFDLFMLIVLVFLAVSGAGTARYSRLQKNIFWLYIIILLYLAAIWNIKIMFSGSNRAIFKYLLTAPLFIMIFNSSFSMDKN